MGEEKKEINRWLDAVTRLIKLTQQGRLKWIAVTAPITAEFNERITPVFQTRYKDKTMRLYAIKTTVPQSLRHTYHALGYEPSNSGNEVVLEFVNDEGLRIWKVPEVNALRDLLAAVQYQAAEVNNFLNDILNESEAVAS